VRAMVPPMSLSEREGRMPLETPFHSRTAELNQARRWRNWSGFFIADSYFPAHDLEYHAVRFSAALFDITPMCQCLDR